MPLPHDGIIHLTGYSRPGETAQSCPKQAMIIRMSDKTLDLLESMPPLHFEFSDNPVCLPDLPAPPLPVLTIVQGLTIGDTFFPVTSVQESSPHDLYLRTSSASKRNVPLKLYANITGKFAVERQLDDRITDKVRASAADAQNQRAGHTTIFLKTPTDLPSSNGKKNKDATMFRKPVRPTDQPRKPAPAASTASSSSGASQVPLQSQRSKEALQDIRNRMIRCIAAAQRTSEQVVKLVGGNDSSAAMKRDILDLLDEVRDISYFLINMLMQLQIAEPVPLPNNSKAPKSYRLKVTSWLEIRPYEIPGLSESERTNMARSAKLALRALKIPESDPAWSYVQYRNPNGGVSSGLAVKRRADRIGSSKVGQSSEPPKRGLMSTSAKRVAKPKDTSDYTNLEPPTSRPLTSSSIRDDEPTRSLSSKLSVTRRPGSGFKAKQPTPTEAREFANGRSPVINGKAVLGEPSNATSGTRRSQNSSSSQASDKKSKKIEELRCDEAAASDSERPEQMREQHRALEAKEDREQDKRTGETGEQEKDKRERGREREERERNKREGNKRDRGAERDRERGKDRERDRMDRERSKRREAEVESDREFERSRKKVRDHEWSQGREEGEHTDDGHRLSKRKIPDDGYESSQSGMKKRKMESHPARSTKPRDFSLPKKLEVDLPPSRPKVTRKESPLPPPKVSKEPTLPKIKKGPISKTSILPAKTPSSSVSSNQTPKKLKSKRRRPEDIYTSSEDEGEIRPVKREPVPTSMPAPNDNHCDEGSFQSRSQTSKPLVIHDYAALRAQYDNSYLPYLSNFQRLMKQKSMIRDLLKKMEQDNTESVTESDGDGDLLDLEELKKLASEYQNQHEDLEKIQQIFSRRDE